jgi:hypothetical protein
METKTSEPTTAEKLINLFTDLPLEYDFSEGTFDSVIDAIREDPEGAIAALVSWAKSLGGGNG